MTFFLRQPFIPEFEVLHGERLILVNHSTERIFVNLQFNNLHILHFVQDNKRDFFRGPSLCKADTKDSLDKGGGDLVFILITCSSW